MTVEEQENEDQERDLAIVKSHVAQLCEHFDTVQVIATRKGEDGTVHVAWGDGNWYARYGSTREWIVKEEERMRDGVREQ